MLKAQISASLEQAFSKQGFAQPNVAQLKPACNVSLRTLYKYYPSKAAMIAGALEYRHQRYLDFLRNDAPVNGIDSAYYIFNKLEQWLQENAPHGCLAMNAIAAFPGDPLILGAVTEHKEQVRQLLGLLSQREDLASAIFVLHEGVSSAWPLLGHVAVTSAQNTLLQLLEKEQ